MIHVEGGSTANLLALWRLPELVDPCPSGARLGGSSFAPLTATSRLRLTRCVVEDGWPLRRAADRFQGVRDHRRRWAERYRLDGSVGMNDRSSRPSTSPRHTPSEVANPVQQGSLSVLLRDVWTRAVNHGRTSRPRDTTRPRVKEAGFH